MVHLNHAYPSDCFPFPRRGKVVKPVASATGQDCRPFSVLKGRWYPFTTKEDVHVKNSKPVMPDLIRHPGMEAQSLDSRLRGNDDPERFLIFLSLSYFSYFPCCTVFFDFVPSGLITLCRLNPVAEATGYTTQPLSGLKPGTRFGDEPFFMERFMHYSKHRIDSWRKQRGGVRTMSSAKEEKRTGDERRRGQERRGLSASDYKGPERREEKDRRSGSERRKRS